MKTKKIVWVHPEYTFTLELPPLVFFVLSRALNRKLAKGTFKPTASALRGMSAHTFIIDEISTLNEEDLKEIDNILKRTEQ